MALVTRLMQTEVVQEHTLAKLIKREFNDCAHFLPSSSVDIGFAANGVVKKLGTLGHIKCTKERQFRSNVKTFSKLLSKKSQKNHQLTLHVSSLSATKISSISVELLVKGFKELLETLFNPLLIFAKVGDCAKVQYTNLISNNKDMEKMEQFDTSEDRFDKFNMTIFFRYTEEVEEFVKLCITLSHGNARIGSGFSINELFLDVNMKDQSL